MAYQPLTKEQFQAARNSGFSTSQIIAMERRRQSSEGGGVSQETSAQQGGFKGFAKSLVQAPATIVARPFQLAAELAGVSEDKIDEFSREKLGGVVAPVPRSGSDVIKDVGRGVETVALGVGGSGAVKAGTLGVRGAIKQAAITGAKEGAKAGAITGASIPLQEKGSEATAGDVAKSAAMGTVFGAATGAVLSPAIAVTGRAASAVNKEARSLIGNRTAQKAAQEAEEAALLQAGKTDARIATKKLEPVPTPEPMPNRVSEVAEVASQKAPEAPQMRVVDDPIAQEAVKQGIPEADVALIKGASNADKKKMAQMIDIRENQARDRSVVDRATDVSGKTALDQFRFVQETNKKASEKLNLVARGLKGKKVNLTDAATKFGDELDAAGVRVKKNGQLEFKGSDFEGIPAIQRDITNVYNRFLRAVKRGDALEAHRLKTYIDNIVEYGAEGQGLSGRAERLIKSLRHNVDETLDTKFPAYNTANSEYAETIGVLNNLGQITGKRFRLNREFADAKMGITLRRILGNAQSRSEILKVLQEAQGIAQKYGMQIDEDVVTQVQFADLLERLYGTEAPTSLGGQTERAVQNAIEGAGIAADFAKGGVYGTMRAGTKLYQMTRGINQENRIKALRELLKVLEEPKKSNFGRPRRTFRSQQ